jgi:hypothetical protein
MVKMLPALDTMKFITCSVAELLQSCIGDNNTIHMDCALAITVLDLYFRRRAGHESTTFQWPLVAGYPNKSRRCMVSTTLSSDPTSTMRSSLLGCGFALQWIVNIGRDNVFWGMTSEGLRTGTRRVWGESMVATHKQLGVSDDDAARVLHQHQHATHVGAAIPDRSHTLFWSKASLLNICVLAHKGDITPVYQWGLPDDW